MTRPDLLTVDDLAAGAAERLDLGPDGVPRRPLLVVDLDREPAGGGTALKRAVQALAGPGSPVIGVCRGPWSGPARQLAPLLDLTLTTRSAPPITAVTVTDLDATLQHLISATDASPRAAAALGQVLRTSAGRPVPEALVVESFAYSMLLSGKEFRAWRARTPGREPAVVPEPVRIGRDDDRLTVTLDHPARRNAFGRAVRDGLVEAFDLVAADPTIRTVRLDGVGPSFCSGGDLDEFGSMTDTAAAHLIRLRQSPGAALYRVAERVTVQLHGSCIGAGIEVPAFAGHVRATPDTVIRLPELGMGLIPGAGGTVSLPRRIGRWRTAFLALSGSPLSAAAALDWGLVDVVVDTDDC